MVWFDDRRCFEAVIGRRRAQRPFESYRLRVIPPPVTRLGSSANRADDQIYEQQLTQTEAERTDGRHAIPVGELDAVVGNATWHPSESQKVLGKKEHVHENRGRPEMALR